MKVLILCLNAGWEEDPKRGGPKEDSALLDVKPCPSNRSRGINKLRLGGAAWQNGFSEQPLIGPVTENRAHRCRLSMRLGVVGLWCAFNSTRCNQTIVARQETPKPLFFFWRRTPYPALRRRLRKFSGRR